MTCDHRVTWRIESADLSPNNPRASVVARSPLGNTTVVLGALYWCVGCGGLSFDVGATYVEPTHVEPQA